MWNLGMTFNDIIWNYFKVKEHDGNETATCQKCNNKIDYLKEQVKREREYNIQHF